MVVGLVVSFVGHLNQIGSLNIYKDKFKFQQIFKYQNDLPDGGGPCCLFLFPLCGGPLGGGPLADAPLGGGPCWPFLVS